MMSPEERERYDALDPQRKELVANLYDMRAVLKGMVNSDDEHLARRVRDWMDAIPATVRFIETAKKDTAP